MDLFLNNRKVTLDENTFLNQGGEAEIYDIGEGEVIKLFKNPDHPDFAGNPDEQTTAEQRLLLLKTKLNELPENLPEQVVIPLEVITDQSGEKILGYTMKYISGATRLKSYRLAPSREELGVSNVDVVEIFRGLHHTVSELHQAGVVIGDFNELNVLIKNKVAYLIDVDSFQFGDYVCRMFTHPFVDPLLCAQSDDESRLVAPYTANSDWYAYTVMLLQSLLLVEPYGGKYDPFNTKDWIPHPERSLHSVSVFHSEVKYPKSSYPYETLPEELLQFFEEVFERNKRTVFPAYLLDMGWKKCASCGREYARSKCPVCAFVIPTIHKRTTVQENVTATQIVKTDEEIAYATFQRGQLLYLYHKGDEYRREDGSVVLQTKHPPQLRYRICGKTTLISWRNRLICFEPDRVYDATFSYNRGSSPVFDTNSTAMFFLSGSHLKRRDRSGLTVMARRLPADTLFWVGEKFGLVCCCNKQTLERMFVFDVNDPVIKHKVYLPAIQADLIEVGCFFSDALCWFFVSVKEQEKVTNQCAVINREGQLTAVSKADAGDGSWLGSVHGKCAIGKSLLSTSEEGIVSVCCKGTAIHPQTFPQTKQFITQDCDLLPGAGGVYVVNKQNITFLQIT